MDRVRGCRVALLWIALCAMGGCEDRVAGTAPALEPGLIGGTVARQKTAVGVTGAVLVLAEVEGGVVATTHSDESGQFRFPEVPSGDYRVSLVAPAVAGIDPLFEVLEPESQLVAVGTDPVDLVFAVVGLVPARITGTVRCDGDPVEGLDVRVAGGDIDTSAPTDAVGIFTVLDLDAGVYAVLPGEAPCELDPAQAVVRVLPGEFVDLEFGG